METENHYWFYAAVWVSVIAMFSWAFWVLTGIGGAWVPWIAGLIFVLAMGSVGVRAWLNAKGVVWTEEMKQAQIQHSREQFREQLRRSIPFFVFSLGMVILINLVQAGILPQWAGPVLVFALFLGWIWLWRLLNRSKI
jgi:hypothetical protein